MVDPISFYAGLKFWLPLASAFALTIKAYSTAKKNLSEWADKLLNNHLTHIEAATTLTHTETVKTNTLLASQALQAGTVAKHVEEVKTTLNDHTDKEMQVWQGVVNTLAILEDRSSRTPRTPRAGQRRAPRRK